MATIHTKTRIKEPDIYNQKLIKNGVNKCFCCSSETQFLISVRTCNHAHFLNSFVKNKHYLNEGHICLLCHRMLTKIELFKRQVEENILLLEDRVPFIKTNKINNWNITPPVTTDSTEPLNFEFEIKTEIEIQNDILDTNILETEIKIEHDHNYFETDIPPPVVKQTEVKKYVKLKKQSCLKKNYQGKIREFNLTVEELRAEREEMAKKDKYLRLPYKCETCIVSFDHNVTYDRHMKTRHTKTDNNYQCGICKSVYATQAVCNEHIRRHYKRLQCLECGAKYNSDHTAMEHYNQMHAPVDSELRKEYTCEECDFRTSICRKYKYHLEKHRNTNKHYCDSCQKTFANKTSYRGHMYTVHKQSSRVYRCEPCNKTYSTKSGLRTHMESHRQERPLAYCAPCRTHYKNKQALMTHLRNHSRHVKDSDKRFICDECGAKFVQKSALVVHINYEHMNRNPHKCKQCSKFFKGAACLRRHIAYVHNKERRPKNKICHYCGIGFHTKRILDCHIRTHTGERPLVCRHCNATFAHCAARYTHIKLKHGGVK